MNEIQIFNYASRQVRTIEKNGEVWFVAKDVCRILDIKNVTQAVQQLDNDERAMFNIGRSPVHGGGGETNIINESGLYKLIFKGRKAEAKNFTRWVTHEVLPAIRRKGYYAVPGVQSQIDELRMENEMYKTRCKAMQKYIQENSSFTMLGQAITPIKGTLSIGEAAKIFAQHNIKIGQNRLYKLLRDLRIVAKRKGRQHNQPTQKAIEQGLCVLLVPLGSKGVPYLTMKGLQKVADILAQKQFPLLALISGAEALHE